MTKTYLFFLFIFISFIAFGQGYKKVSLRIDNPNQILELQKQGFPFEDVNKERDGSFTVFVSDTEFEILKKNSIHHEILIDDWKAYYFEQQKADLEKQVQQKSSLSNTPAGFHYGSMGGFLTREEIIEDLDLMHESYPNIVSEKFSVGKSLEGRDLWVVKISDNADTDEDEPEVLYNSLTHAREVQGPMVLFYFMYYLLENYGVDPQVTFLVDNRELFFMPIINPDGFQYNIDTNPNGGGMWRKNKRDNNDDGVFRENMDGVDLNRNYGYEWGYDDVGSSPNMSDGTYRGYAPFSEPETDAVRKFCEERNFKAALNYHTHSNLLITPWGYIAEETPDSLLYRDLASDMTSVNNYTWGISADIIYTVNGDTDDWMYGEQTSKNKIICFTPEVGNSSDGFWPQRSRIIPLAEENLFMNLYLAQAVGGLVTSFNTKIVADSLLPGSNIELLTALKNKGMGIAEDVKLIISSESEFITIESGTTEVDMIGAREEVEFVSPFIISINENTPAGELINIKLTTFQNGFEVYSESFEFRVGKTITLFADSGEKFNEYWSENSNQSTASQKWAQSNTDFYTSEYSYTESRSGSYSNDKIAELILNDPIDLTGVNIPFFSFTTKYNIESGWDYGQVLISSDEGASWEPAKGTLTDNGSGQFQPEGEPVYHGSSSGWVQEEIDLSEYADKKILVKFYFASDSYINQDGWFIDDIEVYHYGESTIDDVEEIIPIEYSLKQNYPNPFNPSTAIEYSLAEAGQVELSVFNLVGQKIVTIEKDYKNVGRYVSHFNTDELDRQLASGIYFYTLKVNDFVSTKKLLLLK